MLTIDTIILRILLALMAGAIVGFEREYRNKSAGFRTIILICVGSCLFTLVSILLNNGTTDRIASNIVTGIGFIGGGVIFKSSKGVNGLTTAATIWVTAAIGMGLGAGLYWPTMICVAVVIIVLSLFHWIERFIDSINQERIYKIITTYSPDVLNRYEELIKENNLHYKRMKRTRIDNEITGNWKVQGSGKNHDRFIERMLKDDSIKEFDF
ncbi:MAG TPA: MgtC/SapB family protein [Chitinophagaceae bacterium]